MIINIVSRVSSKTSYCLNLSKHWAFPWKNQTQHQMERTNKLCTVKIWKMLRYYVNRAEVKVSFKNTGVSEFFTYAAWRSEAKSSRSALVAASTNHIRLTAALTPADITHGADGALRVAVTSWRETDTRQTSNHWSPTSKIILYIDTDRELRKYLYYTFTDKKTINKKYHYYQ